MSISTSKGGPRPRVINPRAALILAVVVGSLVFGMRRLHDRQFTRTVDFLRAMAFKSLESKDYRTAQLQLTQFLAMKPSDQEARERLSWILTEHIKTPAALEQAFRQNEELLRKGYGDDSLRLRQARVAVDLKLMSDADAHLKLLQSSQSDNPEVWYLSGVTAEATRDINLALTCFKRSLRCSQVIPEAFASLAGLATEDSPPEFQSDALLDRMVKQCPCAKAYRIRADHLMKTGRYDTAIADLWTALDETPADSVLNAMLVHCLQQQPATPSTTLDPGGSDANSNLNRAIQHFRTQLNQSPINAGLRLYLAAILVKSGDRTEAIRILEDGILKTPRAFILHQTLIEYLLSENDPVRARRVLESIPTGAFSRAVDGYCRGRILMAEKQWKEAALALEQVMAFGDKDTGIYSRAQLSLAICRSNCGDADAAVDAFRSAVTDNPDSASARLGMAAAWVKAGQLELAIAEYRQMLNSPGVPAYLADLLILRNHKQSPALRSWVEIDNLLRDNDPLIPDSVQRALLRADRLFAEGRIIDAINSLETATLAHPNQRQVHSALARLNGEFASEIRQRLLQLADDEPNNAEVRATIARQHLAHGELSEALSMIDEIATGKSVTSATGEHSLALALETLQLVIGLERRIDRRKYLSELENKAVSISSQLAQMNRVYERQLVKTLVQAGKGSDAIQYLLKTPISDSPQTRADSLLELVGVSSNRADVLPIATRELYALIARHPQNTALRISYADLMLYAREYDVAEQTLEPLAGLGVDSGRIAARRAWLRAVQEKDLAEAAKLAIVAVQSDQHESQFRETQARVMLAQKDFESAMKMLQSIPADQLSFAGQIYMVLALLNLDQSQEAQNAFDRVRVQGDSEALLPADRDLLDSITAQFQQQTTAAR